MTPFTHNILRRTMEAVPVAVPRLREKFERDTDYQDLFPDHDETDPQPGADMRRIPHDPSSAPDKATPQTAARHLHEQVVDPSSAATRPSGQLTSTEMIISSISSYNRAYKLVPPSATREDTPREQPFIEDKGAMPAEKFIRANFLRHVAEEKTVDAHKIVRDVQPLSPNSSYFPLPPVMPFIQPAAGGDGLSGEAFLATGFANSKPGFLVGSSAQADSTQTVSISIGRIEVRVSQPPPVQAAPKQKTAALAVMSLEEYLHKRKEGT